VAILTHDHFQQGSIYPDESEKLILTRGLGVVSFDDFTYNAVDQGNTSLLILPQQGEQKLKTGLLSQPAELGNLSQVIPGQSLQMVYIPGDDFHRGQPSVLTTRLNDINPDNGHFLLEDEMQNIRPGDSGGGVFHNGKLIGNVLGTFPRKDAFNPDKIINVVDVPPIPLSLIQ